MPSARVPSLLELSFGGLGAVACLGIAVGSWNLTSRLVATSNSVFEAMDELMVTVRRKTLEAKARVEAARATADDIRQGLRSRAVRASEERVRSWLEIEEKSRQLLQGLQQADRGLEIAAASIAGLQKVQEFGSSLGVPMDASRITPFAEMIADLRNRLDETIHTIGKIGRMASGPSDGGARGERRQQALELALRAAAGLGEFGARLESAAEALSTIEARLESARAGTISRIRRAEALFLVLAAWMGAGQLYMFGHGLARRRRMSQAAPL